MLILTSICETICFAENIVSLLILKRFSTSLLSIFPQQIYMFYKTQQTEPGSGNLLNGKKVITEENSSVILRVINRQFALL
jgi:hypothetical protein